MTDAPLDRDDRDKTVDTADAGNAPGTGPAPSAKAAPSAPSAPPAPTADAAAQSSLRRRLLSILAVVVGGGLLIYGAYALFFAPPSEETDDAYVGGDTVTITARDPGQVTGLYADNTQKVRAGQPLIDLDPATADVDLAAAAARLGQAVRGVRADFSNVNAARAQVAQAQADLNRARDDVARRRQAAASGAVSGEEVAHAVDTVTTASAALNLAQSKLAQALTPVQGTDIRSNPSVLAAIADYRRASIKRSHMHVVAPVSGVVAQRTVQIGQQIPAGTPLMAVVPLDRLWVDANFRETQLADIRIGQPVTVTSDTYGGKMVFHGRVIGLGAGSGSAFALLPPQNASGNWIKIVQRVPVRIGLDPKELQANPLRIGLSVKVTVDTASRSGNALGIDAHPAYPVQASDTGARDVEAQINQIIAANAGRGR